ncbi:SAYSvFN domain-containing protein 1 [Amyelois transitella]|uniref:SAYSvFN domain-containing protein 1 n=1 Tax=Amyelois transitella TaxID=680683 RepID=UPI00298F5BC6|nr:SAYSvFN domain-containing protein 1 [Amyelois transitella]
MEAKLKEYRALRRRKELIENAKEKLEKSKEKIVNLLIPKVLRDMDKDRKEDEVVLIENEEQPVSPATIPIQPIEETADVTSETSDVETVPEPNEETWRYFTIKWSLYSLTWLTLYYFFLKLQFGAVFFVISALVGIYLNTRTRPKKKGEVSAYSVFNENCVSIDGTLKAEQFEREIRYGAGTVRAL